MVETQAQPPQEPGKAEKTEECNMTPPAKPGVKNVKLRQLYEGQSLRIFWCMVIVCIICYTSDFLRLPLEFIRPQNEAEAQAGEVSAFREKLDKVLAAQSRQDGKSYVIDERYYDENIATAFISVMHEIDASEIREVHIGNFFKDLFVFVSDENAINLIQKDEFTLLEECEDKTKMNRLDYLLLGLSNDEIMKKSRGFYISQNNPEYKNIPYGSSNLSLSGCGPVSLTVAMNYAAGQRVTYLEGVVNWANENDMYEKNSGTRWSLIRNYPPYMGMKCDELYIRNVEKLREVLSEDGVVIASMGEGNFTDNGHFIVLTGISGDEVSVIDCASIYRSLKKWDIEIIFEEANNYFWKIYN